MRVERITRWVGVPWWAVALVGLQFLLVGAYVGMAHAMGIDAPTTCPLRSLTGIPCPTCGSTRMVLALGQGNLAGAIAYNPLMFLVTIAGLGWLVLRFAFRRRIVWALSPTRLRLAIAALIVAVLANWAYLLATM